MDKGKEFTNIMPGFHKSLLVPIGDRMCGMSGCYSSSITAMSTNGPISLSMQALKIPQISQRLPLSRESLAHYKIQKL